MSARVASLRRGAVATFLAHVVVTLLATVVAWPLAGVLVRGGLRDASDLAATLDAAWSAASGIGAVADVLLVVLLVSAALAPLVDVAWLASLARRRTVPDALALAGRRYLAAWRVRLALAPLALGAVVLLFALPAVVALLARSVVNERTHDLLVLSGALPALGAGAVLVVWHDLALAALATSSTTAVSALLRTVRLAVAPRALGVYLATGAASLALTAGGHVLAAWLDHGAAAGVLVLALTQTLALARTFCRATWLADAVHRVEAR